MTTATTTSAATGKVRRSISCYSLPACGIADDFPDEHEEHQIEERREMFEALKVRRETLNARLAEKLAELKEMCLQEAAITGILPRETPLHPNEPKPVIRRKVRTEFSLSDKLLTEPATEEEKRLSDLELQFEIQSKIVEAMKKLMNERNIKQKVKKQRKANYEDAVLKLQKLDSALNRMRKQLQDEQRTQLENKNKIKKQVIERHLSPPHHHTTSQRTQLKNSLRADLMPTAILTTDTRQQIGSSRLSRKRRGKISSTSSDNDCQSVPASPVVSRESRIDPLTSVTGDMSVHQRTGSKSVPSAAAAPVSILKKSRPAKEMVVYDEPDSGHEEQLVRSNSLEGLVRRKSYVSAVTMPPSAPVIPANYYNHHPLDNKVLPRNPPPPIPNFMAKRPLPPTPSQVIASQSEPSVPDAIADERDVQVTAQTGHCYDHIRQCSADARSHVRREDADISCKAVRSSVIRTPAITITTTSSSDAQMAQNNQTNNQNSSTRPSPSPSPLPTPKPTRCRAFSGPAAAEETSDPLQPLVCPSPTPSSASMMLFRQLMEQQEQQQQLVKQQQLQQDDESKSMPPPVDLPPRKPKKSLVKNIPPPLTQNSLSRSCTPEIRSFTPSLETDQELVPPASPFISFTRTYIETPRPDPIPMSPQVNSQTGVIVEVGTCRPSYEETKPFEFSDALKYSAKHRRRQETGAKSEAVATASKEQASSLKETAPSVPNLMNESFIASAAVSNDFHNEMVDWYDDNVKKATVV